MAIIKIKNQAIDLDAAEIPNLPATKITSGTFDNARISLDAAEIPNLDTAKITTGTLADARVPNLNASKITAGTIATARLGSGTASSSTFLRGDGSFATPVGGANTPAWYARRSATQSISNQTMTKVQFDQEVLDTASAYDNSSNYRWTCPSGQAGYYFIFGNIWMDSGENNGFNYGFLEFRKNGSAVAGHIIDPRDNKGLQFSVGHSFIQNVGVGDYYELWAYISDTSATNITINVSSGNDSSNFGGYKIIT